MKLSIIIPAYNVGKYLDDCLSSCYRQDLDTSDYEVIVVNDGSTDNTLETAERWQASHENLRVISQANKGLSEARNAGLGMAVGTYIMFIDSDDWICDNCLKKLTDTCLAAEADIVRFSAVKIVDGKIHVITSFEITDTVQSGRELLKGKFNVTALAVYRNTFLKANGLEFYPGIYHEDNEFTPRAYYFAKRIVSLNDPIYFVRQTPGSITRTVNPKRINDLITVVERLQVFAENHVEKEYRTAMHYQAARSLNWCLKEMRRLNDTDRKNIWKRLKQKKVLFRHIMKSPAMLHKTEGAVMTTLLNMNIKERFRQFTGTVHEMLEKAAVHIFGESSIGYKTVYFLRARKNLNIDNPQNLNEKLFWLARYWRNPLITRCADKYLVRDYLVEKGCSDILNELYGVYEKAEDIPFDSLPSRFVLKCNHGSHMNIICEDKDSFNRAEAIKKLDKWMTKSYGRGYEWQYRPIPRKIIAEKYIESNDGSMTEYQIFCFNGKPQFFLVRNDLRNSEADRETEQYAVSYTIDWKRVYMRKNEERYTMELPKPKNYQKMIDYATRLSADFPQVRVDYYEVDDRLIFGELTFSSNGNVQSNYKDEYIRSLGDALELPEPYRKSVKESL